MAFVPASNIGGPAISNWRAASQTQAWRLIYRSSTWMGAAILLCLRLMMHWNVNLYAFRGHLSDRLRLTGGRWCIASCIGPLCGEQVKHHIWSGGLWKAIRDSRSDVEF